MNYTEAIEKAVKLLRLSKSSNPNEAALAMSKAQEIIKNFRDDPLDTSGGTWRVRLAVKLARHNGTIQD